MAQLPTKFKFQEMAVTDEQPVFTSESRSLKRLTRRIPAHRFRLTLETVPLTHLERRELWAFLVQHGAFTPFEFELPVDSTSLGTVSGTPTAVGTHPAGSTTVSALITGEYAPGDKIKFSGHAKVYNVLSQSGSDIDIWPPLFNPVSAGEALRYKNITMTVLNADPDVVSELSNNGGWSEFELNFVESI